MEGRPNCLVLEVHEAATSDERCAKRWRRYLEERTLPPLFDEFGDRFQVAGARTPRWRTDPCCSSVENRCIGEVVRPGSVASFASSSRVAWPFSPQKGRPCPSSRPAAPLWASRGVLARRPARLGQHPARPSPSSSGWVIGREGDDRPDP